MHNGKRSEGSSVLVVLATAWLMVQGVVGAATSNPFRTSHLTLDQYSPLPPYRHHGPFELYGGRTNPEDDGNSQEDDTRRRVDPKVEDDSPAYRSTIKNDEDRRLRRGSVVSISAKANGIKPYDTKSVTNPRDSVQLTGKRSKNFAGSNEFGKESVDYAAPPSEMEEPFVADETFQDEGPGSVEIYKLDLFEDKRNLAGPTSSAKAPVVGAASATYSVVPVTSRTSDKTNNNNNNKSKVPKKSSRLAWKMGKSPGGGFKSTTTGVATTKMANAEKEGKDDGKNLIHARSNFSDSELRSEVPANGEAFGVGGVPELQVGCEGLEASSSSSSSSSSLSSSSAYYSASRKLRRRRGRRSANEKNGASQRKHRTDPSTSRLDVVPISLNLDYDWSGVSYEEMDELLKLKKLESEAGKRKQHRGDMDPTLDELFTGENGANERLPVRGDLGSLGTRTTGPVNKDSDAKFERREREVEPKFSRKLLWTNEDSDLWGYGENDGVLPSDGLNDDDDDDERNKVHAVNTEIDKIREEYERLLEKQRREQEERLRRFRLHGGRTSSRSDDSGRDEDERRRSIEERRRMEELRRRAEAARREEELRRRNQVDPRSDLTPEDRRSYEDRRREWGAKSRQEKEERDRRLEEARRQREWKIEMERKRQSEEDRRRQENERNAPSNLIRSNYPYENRTSTNTVEGRDRPTQAGGRGYDEEYRRRLEEDRREEERRRQEERYRQLQARGYEEERRGMLERQRSRYANATRDQTSYDDDYARRLEEYRRRIEEERKLQEYVRRNRPVDPREDGRGSRWNASNARDAEEERRRTIYAVRQPNRSRYPTSSSERRQHGPSAPPPAYVDPRVTSESAGRRQEEEERRRGMREEELRREEEYRRQRSRSYEEERKRLEAIRLREERRRQSAVSSSRTGQNSRPGIRQDSPDRGRQNTGYPVPVNLLRDGDRRETDRDRIRLEEERRRTLERQRRIQENERRRYQTRLLQTQREREERARGTSGQRRRQEEARLNALPVSARIIIRNEGSQPASRSRLPSMTSRGGFEDEISFPSINPHRDGLKAARFPAPVTPPSVLSPVPCVWAIVQCCPMSSNRLVTCFESLGCPGVNWDPNPCRGSIMDAAREQITRFYAESDAEKNRY